MTEDDSDIRSLVRRVHSYEKERFEDKKFSQFEERYPLFVFVSFVCFALEWII